RLDTVALFMGDAAARAELRERLAAAPDLARAVARLAVDRGGPRDLAAVRDGLAAAAAVAARLDALDEAPAEIAQAKEDLRKPDYGLAHEFAAALADELPLFKRDGRCVR